MIQRTYGITPQQTKGGAHVLASSREHAEEGFPRYATADPLEAISKAFPEYRNKVLRVFLSKIYYSTLLGSQVFEPGAGTCTLANLVLATVPTICRYTAIDPLIAARRTHNVLKGRLHLRATPFLEWNELRQYSAAISRFTVHHFPDELDRWYGHIASHLLPGGVYLQCDYVLPEDGNVSLEELIRIARLPSSLPLSPSEEVERWIRHLRRDWALFLPVESHLRSMRSNGFDATVLARFRDQAVIRAVKR